ncbi:DNA-binding transcriptional regulator MelR [compost metagenome]
MINREFKMSFRDFVNRRRVAAAQSMLRSPAGSGNSVMQIGFAVGFNSASAFYAAFQRFARTTPLLYRKNVKVKKR